MKAFLLIERHSVRFYTKGPEIKGVMSVVLAESIEKVPDLTGGKYDTIPVDGEERPIIRLDRKLFSPYEDYALHYEKGPIHLYIEKESDGTHLFIIEIPLLQPSEVMA